MTLRSTSPWTLLFAGLALVLSARPSVAHEGHHHTALGTIRSIAETQLEIETTEGKIKSFLLTDKTTYKHGDTAVSRDHLKADARVAVMYEVKDDKNVAIEVKLGAVLGGRAGAAR